MFHSGEHPTFDSNCFIGLKNDCKQYFLSTNYGKIKLPWDAIDLSLSFNSFKILRNHNINDFDFKYLACCHIWAFCWTSFQNRTKN